MEGLAGSASGHQLRHSAVDPDPAVPEEGAGGFPAELPSRLAGEHTEAGLDQARHRGEAACGQGNGETVFGEGD